MTDIVVIGSLNMDLVVRAVRLPQAGETIIGEDLKLFPGGKGANQAVAATRSGGKVAMVGRVGNDVFGTNLVESVTQQGIDVQNISIDDKGVTGTATILIDKSGENRIIVSPGANQLVSRGDIDRAEKIISQAKFMLLQFEIPLDTVWHAIEMAASYPIQVLLNPAPAFEIPAAMLEKIDYLVPNEIETSLLTGVTRKRGNESVIEGARRLLAGGVSAVIVTLGSRGALLVKQDEVVDYPAKDIKVIDTTAAGDAFIGGLVASLCQGVSLADAIEFANCAGALAVTRLGAQSSLPTLREIEGLLRTSIEER